jgi:hypothetical protein
MGTVEARGSGRRRRSAAEGVYEIGMLDGTPELRLD